MKERKKKEGEKVKEVVSFGPKSADSQHQPHKLR